MKRSEMVEKLGQFLNKELKIVSINAEPILDFLEKEGMFPPEFFSEVQVGTGYGDYKTELCSSYENDDLDNLWEPENE